MIIIPQASRDYGMTHTYTPHCTGAAAENGKDLRDNDAQRRLASLAHVGVGHATATWPCGRCTLTTNVRDRISHVNRVTEQKQTHI